MKKVLIAVAAVFLVLLVAVYVVLFTSFGNKIVAGVIENKAKEAGLELNVSKFVLGFSSLDIEVDISNMLNAKVEGNLSLFKLGFDIDYILALDKAYIKSLNLNPNQDFSFGGKLEGRASDFKANGRGFLFGSNIMLDAHIVDYSPLQLKLNANGIKIEELLALVSKPRYVLGVINMNADIVAQDSKPYGKALINFYTSAINYKLLQNDLNLTLPQNSELSSQIVANVNGNDVDITTDTKNSYLSIQSQNTHYDLAKGLLISDFRVLVPNLSRLESLLKNNAKGALNLSGDLKYGEGVLHLLNAKLIGNGLSFANLPNTDLNLDIKAMGDGADKINFESFAQSALLNITQLKGSYKISNSELSLDGKLSVDDLSQFKNLAGSDIQGRADVKLNAHTLGAELKKLKVDADIAGGIISADSNGKSLDLNIKDVELTKLLVLATQPAYLNGLLNAKVHLSSLDFTNLNGDFSTTSSGTLNQKVLSSLLNKQFPANSKYEFKLTGDIKNSLLSFHTQLKSDLANLSEFKGSFDIKNSKLTSNFILDVFDFSKLSFLAGRKLSGKAVFNGSVDFDKNLVAKITSENLFQGKLDANLKDNVLNATINQVDFASLMRGADLPDYYDAKASVKLDYNLLNSNGNVNANLNNGKLKNVGIIKTISALTKSDFTQDSFSDANLNARLSKNLTTINLNMKSPRVSIGIDKGTVSQNGALNLPLVLGVDKAKFKGTISGTSDNPKVSLDLGSVIQSGINKVLSDDKLKEKGAKELNKLLDKLF